MHHLLTFENFDNDKSYKDVMKQAQHLIDSYFAKFSELTLQNQMYITVGTTTIMHELVMCVKNHVPLNKLDNSISEYERTFITDKILNIILAAVELLKLSDSVKDEMFKTLNDFVRDFILELRDIMTIHISPKFKPFRNIGLND